jgi:hypothetical protein
MIIILGVVERRLSNDVIVKRNVLEAEVLGRLSECRQNGRVTANLIVGKGDSDLHSLSSHIRRELLFGPATGTKRAILEAKTPLLLPA